MMERGREVNDFATHSGAFGLVVALLIAAAILCALPVLLADWRRAPGFGFLTVCIVAGSAFVAVFGAPATRDVVFVLGWGLGSIVSALSHLVGAFQATPAGSTAVPARAEPELGIAADLDRPDPSPLAPADGFSRFLDRTR